MNTCIKKKTQSGRSMIEMLGVLAIVGVLSAGGIAGYSMAMQSYKTNQLIEKIQLISTQARAVYKGNYAGITGDTLVSAGKLKTENLNSPFGGVLSLMQRAGDSTHFEIRTTYNIPAETCVDLITADYGDLGVFRGMRVDETSNLFLLGNGTYPVPLATAISVCKGGNRHLIWYFK